MWLDNFVKRVYDYIGNTYKSTSEEDMFVTRMLVFTLGSVFVQNVFLNFYEREIVIFNFTTFWESTL